MKAFFLPSLAGLLLLGFPFTAPAGETLVVHHFLGPNSPTHRQFIEPWARRVEEQSGGRLAIEIFPSMTLGGKPPELYRQVRDGSADIVWTLTGYTPGVFPRSEAFELPTVHGGSALAANLAIQENFDLIAEDFRDLVPLLVHVHAGVALHMRDAPVRSLNDLAGRKIRTPSRTGAWMLEAWGAEPVGMPVPDLPQAISKGTVDGALIPFEIMAPLRLEEFTAHSVEGPGGRRFGTSVFLFAMNRARYESLPADLRAVIDRNAGAAIAAEAGRLWDSIEDPGKSRQRASGGEVAELAPEAMAAFLERSRRVAERWVREMEDLDIDGGLILKRAAASVARHERP